MHAVLSPSTVYILKGLKNTIGVSVSLGFALQTWENILKVLFSNFSLRF